MSALFDRRVEVVLGTSGFNQARRFSQHRIDFQLDHENGKNPSSGEVSIWNLSAPQRAWLQENADVAILRAGYAGRLVDAFIGEVDRLEVDYRTPDTVTKIVLGDGIAATTTQRVAVSWPAGMTVRGAIQRISTALGLPVAYMEPVARLSTSFLRPRAFNGPASGALEELSQRAGLEWSIQDGQLYFISPAATRRERVYVVSAATGLVGSPELVTKRKERRERVTGVRFRTLLLPELRPNHAVQLQSREFNGPYKAERVLHQGGNGWDSSYYTTVEAKAL